MRVDHKILEGRFNRWWRNMDVVPPYIPLVVSRLVPLSVYLEFQERHNRSAALAGDK